MNCKNALAFFLLTFLLFSGCQKRSDMLKQPMAQKSKNKNIPPKGFFIENRVVPGVVTNNTAASQQTSSSNNIANQNSSPDPDNGDDPITLGQQLNNPYSVANMQQAVNTLYGGNYPISATHLYVRFKPASVEQFITLEETEDLELQDYPMDYEVIQDGDYYQDPSQGTEDFQWLYTVVPVNYNFPQSIQTEVIESLYLPNDNEILEDMAESMAAGAQYNSNRIVNTDTVQIERLHTQVEVFNYTSEQCPCEPDVTCPVWPDCGIGGGSGGGGSSNDPRIPRGTIEVQDIRTCDFIATPIANVAVRQARIVMRRWFKVDRTYTNDQGQFVSSKKFKNKVKILLKTKNNNGVVRKVRGIRLWQALFPVKKRLGVFDEGAMASISFLFIKPNPTNAHDKELPYWVAATTHNSIIEYREYAAEFNIAMPPSNLKVIITNWGFQRGNGAAPLWDKCGPLSSNFSDFKDFIQFFIALDLYLASSVTPIQLFNILSRETDIVIGYAAPLADYNCLVTSSSIKAIVYHEVGHASHFTQAGCDYWQDYRTRITNELVFGNANTKPYGDGTDPNAGVVAVGEMWGNHCEKWFSERHYGTPLRETFSILQGTIYVNDGSPITNYAGFNTLRVPTLNANFASIENFNPNRATDVHRWIPQGICYDLIDNRNDNAFIFGRPIDNVAGYTTQQCFNALKPDVRSIPDFRDRLLQQNGNNQQVQVTQLFGQYGY